MHGPPLHQGSGLHRAGGSVPDPGEEEPSALWLLSGTGEGPPLAAALLDRGWRLRVSVVTAAAARAYAPHPRLELQVGPLAGPAAIRAALLNGPRRRFRWVVDATHPFARCISADLDEVCRALGQPLLRLGRPALTGPLPERGLVGLAGMADLAQQPLAGERLLLAIGSRHLAPALRHSSAAAHFARILDNPLSLQLARAAGLPDERLACLRPGRPLAPPGGPPLPGALERALCRRWAITAVLCRASGGAVEALWRQVASEQNLRLLLLQRPGDGAAGLCSQDLLAKLGSP